MFRCRLVKRRELTGELLLYSFAMTEAADGELLLRTPAGLSRIVNGTLSPPEPLPCQRMPANCSKYAAYSWIVKVIYGLEPLEQD